MVPFQRVEVSALTHPVVSFRVRVNIYDNHDYDDEDRHGVIMKMMESMMVREIMKMLTRIEKHCGVGGGA